MFELANEVNYFSFYLFPVLDIFGSSASNEIVELSVNVLKSHESVTVVIKVEPVS